MFRGLQRRMTLPLAALAGLMVLAAGLVLSAQAVTQIKESIKSRLASQARLLSNLVQQEAAARDDPERLHSLIEPWSQELGVHITLIAAGGQVVADSAMDLAQVQPSSDVPEVMQAIESGQGESIRFDAALGTEACFSAVRIRGGPWDGSVIRLAAPLQEVDAAAARFRFSYWIATLAAALLAAAASALLAGRISRPLQELTRAASEPQTGEQPFHTRNTAGDEITRLSTALNHMYRMLNGRMNALDAERETLAAVLEQMESGVLVVDPVGRVSLVNQAAMDMFSITQRQAVGRSLVGTLRLHQVVDLWERARNGAAAVAEIIEPAQQGQALQVIATPLGGVLSGSVLLLFQDLTRIRRLETIRRDFVSNISHELRTPLASLKALTETLLDEALDDPPAARRFLTRVDTEVDSLALMVEELLELARIESGRVPLNFDLVQPEELLQRAMERLNLQAERAGLALSVETDKELPPVWADAPRMQQVLMNLLHNAIKFTPPGGRISLQATRYDDGEALYGFVLFAVQDTGAGIPADDLPRIFERFYKADRARSGSGTGLGLAISKHLVDAHGGRIWAESIEGAGSTFYFTLRTHKEKPGVV